MNKRQKKQAKRESKRATKKQVAEVQQVIQSESIINTSNHLDDMPDIPFEEPKPKSRPTIYVEPESPQAQTIRTTLRKKE